MTLIDIARLSCYSTLIQIIPNYNAKQSISAKSIFILTASKEHNPDIFQYVKDKVILLMPATSEPNMLRVVVRHND